MLIRSLYAARPLWSMGDEDSVRRQVAEFHAAGVRTFLLNPLAEDAADRVEHVRTLAGIVAAPDA